MEDQVPLKPAPSLGRMFTDVFTSPGEAFEALRGTVSAPMLWVVPMIVSVLLAAVFTFTIFNDATLRSQILQMQQQAIEKAVREGRMTQDQADVASERLESGGTGLYMAIGMVAAVVAVAAFFFAGALFVWLAGKVFLKTPEGYSAHLEMYGSAEWIGILGSIVTLLMMVGLGSMYARPGGSLLVLSTFDASSTFHKLLAAVTIFGFWQTAVVGIGLAKLAGKSAIAGLGPAFGLWIVWVLIQAFVGIGT